MLQSSGFAYNLKEARKKSFQVELVFILQNILFSRHHNFFHTCYYLNFLGATKPVYAPEPHDVGRYIQAEITFGGQISIAKTAGPVDPGMFS
jgi:hypothetical protein